MFASQRALRNPALWVCGNESFREDDQLRAGLCRSLGKLLQLRQRALEIEHDGSTLNHSSREFRHVPDSIFRPGPIPPTRKASQRVSRRGSRSSTFEPAALSEDHGWPRLWSWAGTDSDLPLICGPVTGGDGLAAATARSDEPGTGGSGRPLAQSGVRSLFRNGHMPSSALQREILLPTVRPCSIPRHDQLSFRAHSARGGANYADADRLRQVPTLDDFPYCQDFCQELPRNPDLGISGLEKLPKPFVVGSNPTGGAPGSRL